MYDMYILYNSCQACLNKFEDGCKIGWWVIFLFEEEVFRKIEYE